MSAIAQWGNPYAGEYDPLVPKPERVPEALRRLRWAVWYPEQRDNGKFAKCPRNIGGYPRKANEPETWPTFEQCKAAVARGQYPGFGALLDGSDDLVGVDVDDASETFNKHPEVKRLLSEHLKQGGYVEQSPSGNGYRVFVRGSLPVDGAKHGGLEIYKDKRFITVTGHGKGEIIEDQALVDAFYALIEKGKGRTGGRSTGATITPLHPNKELTPEQLARVVETVSTAVEKEAA